MSCVCIPCYAGNKHSTPPMFVRTTRAAELERNVWGLIFQNLDFLEQMVASAVCKRWRHIISKPLLMRSIYRMGSFKCFVDFHRDFLNSRHILLMDSTSSMISNNSVRKASVIASKLLNFLEPVITARGIFIGGLRDEIKILHMKSASLAISYINSLSLDDGALWNFGIISESVFKKISTFKSKLNTHIHVISDMELSNAKSIIHSSIAGVSQKVTFHFHNVHFVEPMRFISDITYDFELRKDELVCGCKKRKLKDQLEVNIYPLVKESPTAEETMFNFHIVPKNGVLL